MKLLDKTYYGNTVQEWVIGLIIIILVFLILQSIKKIFSRKLKKSTGEEHADVNRLAIHLLMKTRIVFLFVISLFIGFTIVSLPPLFYRVFHPVLTIVVLLQLAFWGNEVLAFFISHHVKKKIEVDTEKVASVTFINFMGKFVLWSVIFMLALENLGIDAQALLTGLGISAIAVALAVQNILGDLFASLSIMLDKPFVVGDYIVVGDLSGNVEKIGLKTTRVRSLPGEQIIFSNTDLLKSRIKNYARLKRRRAAFSIGVTYQTPGDKLESIPSMLKQIIESLEKTSFDRAHLKQLGDYAIVFEVVYYVESSSYLLYMDIQQEINLSILKEFDKNGIELAYPTQTLFVETNNDKV